MALGLAHNEANILIGSHSCFYTSSFSWDIHEKISDIIYQNQLYSLEMEVRQIARFWSFKTLKNVLSQKFWRKGINIKIWRRNLYCDIKKTEEKYSWKRNCTKRIIRPQKWFTLLCQGLSRSDDLIVVCNFTRYHDQISNEKRRTGIGNSGWVTRATTTQGRRKSEGGRGRELIAPPPHPS